MKKYEVFHPETGHVFGYYDTIEEAEKALKYVNNPKHFPFKVGEYVIIELPEVEEPEVDYQKIDCLINEMLECMEQICNLANLDHISLSYIITKLNGVGAFMSAWRGEKFGTTYIGNRINIFKRIHNQIKAEKHEEN